MWRTAGLVAMTVALALGSCTDAEPANIATAGVPSQPVRPRPTTPAPVGTILPGPSTAGTLEPRTGSDQPPLIALTTTCYGLCAWAYPAGLTSYAVYGDGSVVVTEVAPGRQERFVVSLRSGALNESDATALFEAARTAGLGEVEGGVLSSPTRVDDGGGLVFASRLAGRLVVLEAPHLQPDRSNVEAVVSATTQRGALAAFWALVEDLVAGVALEPLEPVGWVLVARPRPGDELGGTAAVDPSTLDLYLVEGVGAVCTILPGNDPLGAELAGLGWPTTHETDAGRWQLSARPAYPHEATCGDIDRYLDVVHGSG